MPFAFEKLKIDGLTLIKAATYADSRGFFAELYKESDFAKIGVSSIKQINFSKSSKGVLRGIHYQLNPYAQGKIVRVVSGKIFDVAVDLRKESKTFGQWEGVLLDGEKFNMFYIPEGFAHGFEVLSDIVEFEYFCTQIYAPQHERGLLYNDPSLNIAWNTKNPTLSDKDLKYPPFSKNEKYF
jgi:dTDP-4-dehydrorhamnose 3,5-epimerase